MKLRIALLVLVAAAGVFASFAVAKPPQGHGNTHDGGTTTGTTTGTTATTTTTASGHGKGKKAAKGKEAAGTREGSKTAQVVAMLQRKGGATLVEIMEKMGWQRHTVRGFMAGAMKKAGYTVESFKPEGGERTYRLSR